MNSIQKDLPSGLFFPGDEVQAHEYAGDTSITMMYWLPNKTFEETAEYFRSVIEKRENGQTENLDFVIIYQNRIIGSIYLHFESDKTTAYLGWVLKKVVGALVLQRKRRLRSEIMHSGNVVLQSFLLIAIL